MSNRPLLLGTGFRGRVERLLRSEMHKDDLRELFFSMRADAPERGFVSEIANFLAHPEIRTQGIVRKELCDIFAFLKFRVPFDRSRIITSDLPATFPDAIRANLRRMRKSALRKRTGKNRPEAGEILELIFSRMKPTGAGRISKLTFKNRDEFAVLQCVFSEMKGGSFFTDNDLFEDFRHGLQQQKILHVNEKEILKQSKSTISLFALVAMHNRTIDLGDGSVAKLAIASDVKKRLGIFAFSEVVKDYGSGPMTVGAWVFETGLPINDYCEQDVASPERTAFVGDFEINPQGKLARLT